jgi:hypothetical protein
MQTYPVSGYYSEKHAPYTIRARKFHAFWECVVAICGFCGLKFLVGNTRF